MLNRRLQILVDEPRYARLARESERVGAPIGELVRRAIDREYPAEHIERSEAARRLLDLPPPPGSGPEPDWEDRKREMLDARGNAASQA